MDGGNIEYDISMFGEQFRLRIRDLHGRFAAALNRDDLQREFATYIAQKVHEYVPYRSGALADSPFINGNISVGPGGARIFWDAVGKNDYHYAQKAYTAGSHEYPQQLHPLATNYWDEVGVDENYRDIYRYGEQLVKKAILK